MKDFKDIQDHLRREACNALATTVLNREIDGNKLSLQVSPCSWMYPGYGLQVQITMAGGGVCYFKNEFRPFKDATEDDLNKLFDRVKLVKCSRCGQPAFDPAACDTNRAGLCESCFMADLNKEFQKSVDKENRKLAKLDAKRKTEGFTHRVNAWVHPHHGSDYQINVWFKGLPSKEGIAEFLRKEKSSVLDDYQVVPLI